MKIRGKLLIVVFILIFMQTLNYKVPFNEIKTLNHQTTKTEKPRISAGDFINFISPHPSEIISQNYYYNINVSINVTGSFGSAYLKIYSTDAQNPELDWIAMNKQGATKYYNYTINPIDFPNYNSYNFSIKIQYTMLDFFYNYTIISINNTAPNIVFVNPINSQLISTDFNLNINVSINDLEYDPIQSVELKIYSINPNTPELDWVIMEDQLNGFYNFTINPIEYLNKDYHLLVNATDEKNWHSEEILITINNTAPEVEFIYPLDYDVIILRDLLNINVSINDVEGDIISVKLKIYITNPNNPTLDWVSMEDQLNGYFNFSFDPLDFENGDYRLLINASDLKGWSSNEIIITLNIDRNSNTTDDDNTDDDKANQDTPNENRQEFNIWIPIISGIISAIAGIIVRILYRNAKKGKEKLAEVIPPITPAGKQRKLEQTIREQEKTIFEKYDQSGIQWDEPKPKVNKAKPSSPLAQPIPFTNEELKEKEKTQSEVGVEKTHFICLVHKGLINGNIYVCPNCQTTYCSKCAETLKQKHEHCWSCEKPIMI